MIMGAHFPVHTLQSVSAFRKSLSLPSELFSYNDTAEIPPARLPFSGLDWLVGYLVSFYLDLFYVVCMRALPACNLFAM